MQDPEDKILRAIEALVKIEMIALGQAKAYAGQTDAERLQALADIARDARKQISATAYVDLRQPQK